MFHHSHKYRITDFYNSRVLITELNCFITAFNLIFHKFYFSLFYQFAEKNMFLYKEKSKKIIQCYYSVYNQLGYGFLEKGI